MERNFHMKGKTKLVLSTVLAQDHFSSDFLSLHLAIKDHKEAMMMVRRLWLPDFFSVSAAGLMKFWSPPVTEWLDWPYDFVLTSQRI